jgi:uncharacterized membrane protein YkoI
MRRILRAAAALVLLAGAAQAQQAVAKPEPKVSKSEAALRAQAKVTEEAARATALAAVPGATVKSGELEKENGKLVWSFDLTVTGKKGVEEVQVDAITGKIVSKEHESDAAEKAEAKAEKTNKAARKP